MRILWSHFWGGERRGRHAKMKVKKRENRAHNFAVVNAEEAPVRRGRRAAGAAGAARAARAARASAFWAKVHFGQNEVETVKMYVLSCVRGH